MNQQDDLSGPAPANLHPGKLSPASDGASADPGGIEERGSETPTDGIDKHGSLRGSLIEHNSDRAIMIEGYRVPSSLAAMVVPEPSASPPRSIVGILVDFGGAAVVATVVALFATGELTAPWNMSASGKTEERPANATARSLSAPNPLEFSVPAVSQSSVAATRPESENRVGMVATPATVPATTAAPADAVFSRSPPPVSAKADSDAADDGQQATAAVLPTDQSEKASPLFAKFVAAELQSELKRVGCDPGNTEGDWNAASRRALERFNKHAGTKLDVRVASLDALGVIRSRKSRICALACDRGSRIQGNRCVHVEPLGGRRNADRNHMKRASAGRPTPSPATAPTAPAPSSGTASEPVDWRRNANF